MDGVEARQKETVQRLRNKLVENREIRAAQQAAILRAQEKQYSELEERTRDAATD